MKCFYDFEKITTCVSCNATFEGHLCCDNSCGSFECENCKQEFYAQYMHDLNLNEVNRMTTQQHWIIETFKGIVIICKGHNFECGELD